MTKDVVKKGIPLHALEKASPIKERVKMLNPDEYTRVGKSKGYAKNLKMEMESLFKGRSYTVWPEGKDFFIGRIA